MELETFESALEEVVRTASRLLLEEGRATIEVGDHSAEGGPSRVITLTPRNPAACPFTVLAQSDSEVSFFVGPPGRTEAFTVDLWNRDADELLQSVGSYVEAILDGRIEVDGREGSGGGRVVFVLAEGEPAQHYYNSLRRPRLRRWTRYRFEPY